MGILQSSPTQYAPLSEAEYFSSSGDGGSFSRRHWGHTHNVFCGGWPPLCSSWQYLALACMFFVGLLVGGAFGMLRSTSKELATLEEMALTGVNSNQFAPQSK